MSVRGPAVPNLSDEPEMARVGSWADLSVKPKGKTSKTPKREKGHWDVDSSKADHIYSQFTRFDRPESAFNWGAWYGGERKADEAMVKRLKASVSMVQNFVDALSGEQSNYVVSLSPSATTASTDLRNRIMRLPSKTILDPALSDQEAALLMVAFLGHEIGHVRIDDEIDTALRNDTTILDKGLYNSLSTILREARVEAGFSDLFPGYSGLFEPMLRWISRETKDGSLPPKDALGFAVAATRYPFRFDWSDPIHAAEAAWWVRWVERNSRVDEYAGHKAALDEAVAHIKAALKGEPEPNQPEQGDGEASDVLDGIPGAGSNPGQSGEQDDDGEGGDAQGEGQSSNTSKTSTGKGGGKGATTGSPYEAASGGGQMGKYDLINAKNKIKQAAWIAANELRAKARNGEMDYGEMYDEIEKIEKKSKADQAAVTRNENKAKQASASIPASIEQVDQMRAEAAAKKGRRGRQSFDQHEADIQDATNEANTELGFMYDGAPVKPAMETEPQARAMGRVESDPEATGIFRTMFVRMRGGNDARIGGKRSGRLDDRRIFRLADKKDDRVFSRRGAPKTQHLRVYLMVDTSGSMAGEPERQIRSVSKALIESSFGADKITLEVWGWDNTVVPIWKRGDDPDEVLRLRARGGTNDVSSLLFAIQRMRANLRQEEHGLIIMMSDGAGQGNAKLKMQAEKARAMGMSVFGITMAEKLDQTEAYGQRGFIRWQGSVAKTAAPLAEIISQAWLTKDQHREGGRS